MLLVVKQAQSLSRRALARKAGTSICVAICTWWRGLVRLVETHMSWVSVVSLA
jgi:hypothetical protein